MSVSNQFMCIENGRKSICGVHFKKTVSVSKLNLFNTRKPLHFFAIPFKLGEKLQSTFRARWRASCLVGVGFNRQLFRRKIMKNSYSENPQGSPQFATPQGATFSPWQQLKGKKISYLTLPLLCMATVTEFVILATGWKYQKVVCVPQGMGVTFFGIGPIGATILAVELLKLPLAIWTASRQGWQKAMMVVFGLPLICLLTFQLVKDMAVYEMGVALTPATQMLEKATAEEEKITQLSGQLAEIETKKNNREQKLAELDAKQAKAKADLDDAIKRNEAARQDAINLTDYQKKQLADVDAREATIIQQCNADSAQLTQTIADLRARRETELTRDSKWNAEEARIDNAYKAAMADYTNKKTAYDKAKAEYDNANFVKKELMKEPVDPGVPPVRESNTVLKSALLAEIEAQIKSKEAELAAVDNKRRDRIAQVEDDARKLRDDFDHRSGTKRDESDRERDKLTAQQAALAAQSKAEREQTDADLAVSADKVDGIRTELDAAKKRAEGFYEAREAAIRTTQVHRIATTVEIIRGLIKGERPMSIKATAKERGDILTDQISMVRIWVYPVLAFIVAFLPTLMVEIGFSTVFQPEKQRPAYRLGFLGRRLHWLYMRAGRQKILRAERIAREATAGIVSRDKALITAKALANQAQTEKDLAAHETQEALCAADAFQEAQLTRREEEHAAQVKSLKEGHAAQLQATENHAAQLQGLEDGWNTKLAAMTDSLNRAVTEKDALRDSHQAEIERQIQTRQKAWSDSMNQLRQQLDDLRLATEEERTATMQEHHKKLLEVTEDSKKQIIQARREMAESTNQLRQQLDDLHIASESERAATIQEHQKKLLELAEDGRKQLAQLRREMAAAETAAAEASSKLTHDLKEATLARNKAESQLQQQVDAASLKLSQSKDDAARDLEKAARQEKLRLERQQLELAKTLRQREEDHERQWKLREQEMTLAFDARLAEERSRMDQDANRHKAELERQFDARSQEADARWKQEMQQQEAAAQIRFKQREQQLQAQSEGRFSEIQKQTEQELRRRAAELERQIEAQAREAGTRLKQELAQKELAFESRVKQREQELTVKAHARETELQSKWNADLRLRDEEWERQAESRVRAAEIRLAHEAQQKEELFLSKSRQNDQQWQMKLDAVRAEFQSQTEEALRRRESEVDASMREREARLRKEMQEQLEASQAMVKQREQDFALQVNAQAEARRMAAQAKWEAESDIKVRAAVEPFKTLLARTERERDEAREASAETARQLETLEKQLTDTSVFLNAWRNGKSMAGENGSSRG